MVVANANKQWIVWTCPTNPEALLRYKERAKQGWQETFPKNWLTLLLVGLSSILSLTALRVTVQYVLPCMSSLF